MEPLVMKLKQWYNIFIILIQISIIGAKIGPTGMERHEQTTCDEFSKYARFNPYSVLKDRWFIFYYWAPPAHMSTYVFALPTQNETEHLHMLLDDYVTVPVNWTATLLLMKDDNNKASLLVERNDRGHYWLYVVYHSLEKGLKLDPIDIRIKQTGDNKYLGMLACEAETVVVMARFKDIPRKNKIQDEAARIGYRGKGGRSYLYQGHQWMPIPEADDREFWALPKRRFMFE
ncbi:hypothetical protein O3G_MSEX004601 [Manduca sexta]|uniref:Uncharacterized protein n=1 Tax=Manduca sexta TaxID=7130 RepID=A0A922CI85_MANSE|nr:hypothetical protein O3G_MSEX004601 [Manduca sexta]